MYTRLAYLTWSHYVCKAKNELGAYILSLNVYNDKTLAIN